MSAGAAGTAGDGFRIPVPRLPDWRECADPAEPGARLRVAAVTRAGTADTDTTEKGSAK